MYLIVEENINCHGEERVFGTLGPQKSLTALRLEHPAGTIQWFDVTGVNEESQFIPAQAVRVQDSGAGDAWLIFGGPWGLRFKPLHSNTPWNLKDQTQWGTPFKVLDASGEDIRF